MTSSSRARSGVLRVAFLVAIVLFVSCLSCWVRACFHQDDIEVGLLNGLGVAVTALFVQPWLSRRRRAADAASLDDEGRAAVEEALRTGIPPAAPTARERARRQAQTRLDDAPSTNSLWRWGGGLVVALALAVGLASARPTWLIALTVVDLVLLAAATAGAWPHRQRPLSDDERARLTALAA